MKKAICLIIAAAMLTSSSAYVFAQDNAVITEAVQAGDGVDLFASIDGIMFEYDYSASTELVRVVKVKYDKTYFTKGINEFKVEINIPSKYVESVSSTTKLSAFETTENYEGGVYTYSGTCETNKTPVDSALFTMKITLKENIVNPFTISLTGDSMLGDTSGIKQSLSNGGLNPVSVEIPKNINDVGDSGVDGAVSWEYANSVLKLHGNGTMKDYEQGSTPWYKYADKIKSIEFTEDNLQNIGKNAFYGLKNAENVKLSVDIRTINSNAFEGCTSLKNIDIPTNSGVGIGEYAFKDCSALSSVVVPSGVRTIGKGAFSGCTRISSMTLPFIGSQVGESNSKNTFSYIFDGDVPSSLKAVTITNETNVPESAFEDCQYIENISLNSEIKTLGTKAFKGCSKLKKFEVPEGVSQIQGYTFQDCSAITEIVIGDNITEIGEGAFYGCASLASIYVPNVSCIYDNTFRDCSSLKAIEIPTSVDAIGENVLTGCKSLVDVTVPFVGAKADPGSKEVTSEGMFGYFFGGDNNSVPASVTKVEVNLNKDGYIPKEAFKNCANIEDILINNGQSILDNAFANCRNLKNAYIPKRVSDIGETIFADCDKLETLTVPFIGEDRTDEGHETSVLGALFGYDDDDRTKIKQYYDNANYHYYKIPKTLKNVSVLNQVTIPYGAFMNCYSLENVSLVSGAELNEYAFFNCQDLVTVSLPDNMTKVNGYAFSNCENLETINIPSKVKTLGDAIFYGCENLSNVTIPDSVTDFAEDLFNGTNLLSVDDEDDVSLFASNVVFTCSEGSAAYEYATSRGIATNVVPSSELDIKNVSAKINKLSTNAYLIDVTDTHNFDGTVYAAIYDKAGTMLAVKSEKTSTEESEYRFEFTEEESKGISYAKVFVFGDDEVTPLTSDAVTLTDIPA